MVSFTKGKILVKFLYWVFILFLCVVQITVAMDSDESSQRSKVVFLKPDKIDSLELSFRDFGEKFQFKSERGEWVERSLSDYEIRNQKLYDVVSQTRAIIFGGMHLTAKEAFELSKKYAREGNLDLMINAGISLHEGHIVVNSDLETKPDYKEDFTQLNLIKKLKLENQFSIVVFENVRPSLTLEENGLKNAWDALSPGGRIIIYPATPLHQFVLSSLGFKEYNYKERSYRDLLRDVVLGFPACVAIKPKLEDQN